MRIAPFKLERFFARHEFSAPYLLCASDCESVSLRAILELDPAAADGLKALRLGYTEAAGSPQLRSAVARLYETVTAGDVLLCAGSSEAIFAFMNCALSAGDHIVVQHPCYQSHYEVARAIGCDVTQWVGDETAGWSLDPCFLERSIKPNTKAVMLTVPHNPTGYLMSRAAQGAIVDICRKNGLWLFSDEIFRFLEQDSSARPPAAADLYERAVSVSGLSKTFGLAGVRVGWLAAHDRELIAGMAALKDYLSLCNGAADEFIAGIALEHRDALHRRNLDIINANLGPMDRLLERQADLFSWQRLRAGTVGLVRYKGSEGAKRFCDDAIATAGVLLLPSTELEFGDAHFRVGLGRTNASESIVHFERFLTHSNRP
ncbi:MAG: aminotransferase class I/II-fold pyridoxal phosphate-dependent enzyme [Candidatus Eremiobacteraeota bacterium]|nr:aminotransferase class I/II-fold pyridoxal phosphate-dependent enzyme [Candidatus Eremiobacteraeota bacterium]